jgi:hypothetical protein
METGSEINNLLNLLKAAKDKHASLEMELASTKEKIVKLEELIRIYNGEKLSQTAHSSFGPKFEIPQKYQTDLPWQDKIFWAVAQLKDRRGSSTEISKQIIMKERGADEATIINNIRNKLSYMSSSGLIGKNKIDGKRYEYYLF